MSRIKPLPSMEDLRAWFEIEGADVIWSAGHGQKNTGKRAGNRRKDGYIEIRKEGHKMLAHRIAYAIAYGSDPGDYFVDHIDGNPSNNAASNLRLATHAQNMRNSRRLRRNNSSGSHGVQFCVINGVEYWKAHFNANSKSYYIGAYATKEAAIAAREVAERFAYGDFSPLATLPPERLFASPAGP